MDCGVAAWCCQKYSFIIPAQATGGYEGHGGADGLQLCKELQYKVPANFKALKPTDGVGGRGYIESSWCWYNFSTWFL